MSTRHDLDPYPIPKEESPMYINEPWLIDHSLLLSEKVYKEPEDQKDNLRVYIPLDLNAESILRRLKYIIFLYGDASEDNEMNYSLAVDMLISQIEIFDQIWFTRHMPASGKHSKEAIDLVKRFIELLEGIPDACAEIFPFETIDKLRAEYL